MQIGLRQFGSEEVEWFREAAESGRYSRYALAKALCDQTGWLNAGGDLCVTQAFVALPKLAAECGVSLPELRGARPAEAPLPVFADAIRLRGGLARLGAVSIEPVAPQESRQWRAMMQTHHPRGEPRLPGAAIKYWIVSEHCGRVGGLSFHAASWHERARDDFIGWSQRQRAENLSLVVNNARFLILPEVRVRGLASAALTAALERLPGDWLRAYGAEPLLAYTHIDRSHSGESYRAAGWELVGETSGRRCAGGERKQVFVRPLAEGWREGLCAQAAARFRPAREPHLADDAHWTDVEYGASTHPDGRVGKRIRAMGRAWQREPGARTPQVFATEAGRKAAYRLLSSDNVTMDDILESHRQATVSRGQLHEVVLAVQDTTGLNYDTLKGTTQGLMKIGGTAQGIYAHANVAFSPGGRVLGVLDIDGSFRPRCAADDDLKESRRWVEGLETAAELSAACGAKTRVISVGDRESDIWGLFERQRALRGQVGLLVRRNGSRRRKVVDEDGHAEDLRAHVESLPAAATRTIKIGAQGGRRARDARTAKVTLRIAEVQLKAPGASTDSVPVTAVSVLEESPPAGVKEPLNWFLLCSEGGADADNAVRICEWYEARWGIEEFFRVLKSGCQSEARRFDDAEDLLKCLAFDAITAWRVFDLQRLAKCEPDRPAAGAVPADELEARQVMLYEIDRHSPPRAPPDLTVREYVVGLGRAVGFRPTRRQPVPGTKILWRATQKLMHTVQAINSYKARERQKTENDSQNALSSVGC